MPGTGLHFNTDMVLHSCLHCGSSRIKKRGFFKPKWSRQRIRRYQCKSCNKSFSSHTRWLYKNQKKPYLNQKIFSLYSNRMTLRGIARELKVSYTTVYKKFKLIGEWAEAKNLEHLKNVLLSNPVQFDEQFSFEHTKCKPLSISMAVEAKPKGPYPILVAEVGRSKTVGRRGKIAKYSHWKDQSQKTIQKALKNLQPFEPFVVQTDLEPTYPKNIRTHLERCIHERYKPVKNTITNDIEKNKPLKSKVHDPLFAINHTMGLVRERVSRMNRRSWVTTKKMENLKLHLHLFIAHYNGHQIDPYFSL